MPAAKAEDGLSSSSLCWKTGGLVLSLLFTWQAYLGAEKDSARHANQAIPNSITPAEHVDTIREYASFLLQVPKHAQIKLSWDQIERYVLFCTLLS